jgi:hypothetical protein
MIIQNGTIEVKAKTGGGINPETGYPVKPVNVSWSEPIPCQYSANKYNKLGKYNGEHFTVAQYIVLLEEQPFEAEQVKLKSLDGKVIGEFSIMEIEPLEAVCELRILI